MNARQRLGFGLRVAQLMTVSKIKVYTNVLICGMIFIGGIMSGNWSLAIPSMAFVQSVNIGEMVTAYQEAKQQPRIEQVEEPPKQR